MSKNFFNLLIIIALAYSVCAETVVFDVKDFNTLADVENANVTYNLTGAYNLTNAYGVSVIAAVNNTYQLKITKTGYFDYIVPFDSATTATQIIYIYPVSHGIIRIRTQDLTISEHEYDLAFTENGRLYGHYLPNETAQIGTNINYTILPTVTRADLMSSSDGLLKYGFMYAGGIFSGVIFIGFILLIGYLLWKIIRK